MDFTEFETWMGGTWRVGGVADYWSKLELGWHVSTTQNHRDAIETVEQAIEETERLLGGPLAEILADPTSGELRPIALVTDNGPCFKAVRFATYIARRQHLYRLEIDDGFDLGRETEAYRQLFNQIRPHEALAMRRPLDVHLEACKSHQILKSTEPETLPTP